MPAYKNVDKSAKLKALVNLSGIMKEAEAKGTKSGKRPAGSPEVGDANLETVSVKRKTGTFTSQGGSTKKTVPVSSHTEKYTDNDMGVGEPPAEEEVIEGGTTDEGENGEIELATKRANPGDTRKPADRKNERDLGSADQVDKALKSFLVKGKRHKN